MEGEATSTLRAPYERGPAADMGAGERAGEGVEEGDGRWTLSRGYCTAEPWFVRAFAVKK